MTVFLAWSGVGTRPFSSVAYAAAKDKKEKKEKKEKQDPREMQAREAFAAGNYKDALEFYTKLYAEKLHPTYLRNIGRCYQNLDDRDHAISSFREYLRKAKDLPVDERAEVEGYIKELEDAKQKAAAVEAEKAKPVPLTPAPPPPDQKVLVVQPQPMPQPEESHPFYTKGWFWGVVAGVVVVGVVGTLAATGTFNSKTSVDCPAGTTCQGH
jgi:tetratricopeptide (TPR) repeat protein